MPYAIRIHQFGGPDVMSWEEAPLREPRPGEVRLRHTAIGLNFVEVYQREGVFPFRLPFTPGNEGVGIVEALGDGVTDISVGDRMAYAPVPGSYSEVRLIAAERLVRVPPSIDDNTAAAIMLKGMTAQYLLRQSHVVKAGESVLVHAAAGGMGMFLCQWASALGATVFGTVSTPEKADIAASYGCQHPIVYTKTNFVDEIRYLTGGAMVDVIYDGVGKQTFLPSIDCLRPLGHLISFGDASGPPDLLDIVPLGDKGSLTVTRATLATFTHTREGLLECANGLFEAIASGAVEAPIKRRFELRDAASAHRELEGRRTVGCSILTP
jgi:NADPH2:quinone reductase